MRCKRFLASPLPRIPRDWPRPGHICIWTGCTAHPLLHRDGPHTWHICTGDWAHLARLRICTGTSAVCHTGCNGLMGQAGGQAGRQARALPSSATVGSGWRSLRYYRVLTAMLVSEEARLQISACASLPFPSRPYNMQQHPMRRRAPLPPPSRSAGRRSGCPPWRGHCGCFGLGWTRLDWTGLGWALQVRWAAARRLVPPCVARDLHRSPDVLVRSNAHRTIQQPRTSARAHRTHTRTSPTVPYTHACPHVCTHSRTRMHSAARTRCARLHART